MTIPAFIFGTTVASLMGTAFHLWRGGGFWRLVLSVVSACLGFWSGHGLAGLIGLNLGRVGPTNFFFGLVGSAVFLFVIFWLGSLSEFAENGQ